MRRSTDRILVSHVGVLPRPSAFDEVLAAEGASQPEFERVLSGAVGQVVGRQSEWQVWEDVALPDGRLLMPGMVGHCTDLIEHPALVAHRIVRMAQVVGQENVIAGDLLGEA